MDYGALKELAEAFVGRGCEDYPAELEAALRDTATTGIVRMQWNLFCPLLHYRLEKEMNLGFPGSELGKEDKEMSQQLLQQLDNFDNPPFTVQRLCELILQPKKHYKKVDCYMRAVEKNLLVVGTHEPDLQWMNGSRLQASEKPSQKEVKINDGNTDIDKPHSPQTAPQGVSPDNDSPPSAPTSTWPNLREEGEEKESEGGRRIEKEGRDLTPLLSGRKRSRDSLEQEEDDKFSITVRQEADSTVNFEPPPFDPPPPLFQGVDESPSKRSRECTVGLSGGGRRGEVGGEDVSMEEEGGGGREGVLSSSTELEPEKVTTCETSAGVGQEGEGKENSEVGGEVFIQKDDTMDKTRKEATLTGTQDTKQVSSEFPEAMITD